MCVCLYTVYTHINIYIYIYISVHIEDKKLGKSGIKDIDVYSLNYT